MSGRRQASICKPGQPHRGGTWVRAHAEGIPLAIMAQLGMSVGELQALRDVLSRVIPATRGRGHLAAVGG